MSSYLHSISLDLIGVGSLVDAYFSSACANVFYYNNTEVSV